MALKDIRIFVASSKELVAERNALAFLVLAMEDEFEKRGLRVRLAKWEYVDPTMTAARTEDRYLDEMYDCDGALILFRSVLGMYTREEMEKALVREKDGCSRLKAHRILFKEGAGAPTAELAAWRAELSPDEYGTFAGYEGLKGEFLALVERLVELDGSGEPGRTLLPAAPDSHVRRITAFLAADDELASDRDAFADTVLNLNDLLGLRNLRVRLRFCGPGFPKDQLQALVSSSEMGLVLYGTNVRAFGQEEIKDAYERKTRGENPKRLYVFFRDDEGRELSAGFREFRDSFVDRLGHFVCQFGGADTLRLSFLLSLERYAGETVEVYSTVSAPTASLFVGREDELRRLHELLAPVPGRFPAGRLPVVTGAGGTGKSELVRQYASQFRVQYPGGVFQVDMEHARTWDDVFLGILEGTPNNGVKARDYLGLKTEGPDGEDRPEPMTGAKVRDALLRKSRTSGPVLLVLDNVEGCLPLLGRDGGFAKAFPAGFSERVLVNVVATARVCDTVLRPDDWAVPFPLGDISRDAALELLLEGRAEVDEAERSAAARIAELLGCRALYLRRVPALVGDLYAEVVCDSYAELARALEENLLETVAAETEENHLPSALWKMTCERLAKVPLGKECIRLAQAASFFSPDGFARHVLRHLWKTVVAPGLDDRKFDRAVAVLRHHNVLQSTDPVRMHRLDRAAVLQTAKADPALEDAVGAALAAYGLLARLDWEFLCEHEKMRAYLPQELLKNGRFWANVLVVHPDLAEECPWEVLSGGDLCALLGKWPQFADRCAWEKLDGGDWCKLLQARPEFSGHCSWGKLNGIQWGWLLARMPQFADCCPWDTLEGNEWVDILRLQPQLACHCHVMSLDGWQWNAILQVQPQLAENCPWERLDHHSWAELLAHQPQFAEKCPWEEFESSDWVSLLQRQPSFSSKCPWNELDGSDWSCLLQAQPGFSSECPWERIGGGDWSRLLRDQPQFSIFCDWNKLSSGNWVYLLCQRPEFSASCPWEKLGGGDWSVLLAAQPRFSAECPWEKLEASDWAELLCARPEFMDRCPWDKMDGGDWCELLKREPQLASRCDWGRLSGGDWSELLQECPQFADRCDFNSFSGRDWCGLLSRCPGYSTVCDWTRLGGRDWKNLLKRRPEFAGLCQWEKLESQDWYYLLAARPEFVRNCPQGKLREFSSSEWVNLVLENPILEEVCPWGSLVTEDWCRILYWKPQLADRCAWIRPLENDLPVSVERQDKIPLAIVKNPSLFNRQDVRERLQSLLTLERDGVHYRDCPDSSCLFSEEGTCLGSVNPWAFVLYWRPELAETCTTFEKFNGYSRCLLLSRQPQFADRWSMEELASREGACWAGLADDDFEGGWAKLLAAQPQFAKWRAE